MDVRVLGPVELWAASGLVDLTRRQQRLILGILAVEANRFVSRDRLINLIWEESPPRQARAVVQTRVSELRSTLARNSLDELTVVTRDNGYLLEIDPDRVDLHRFRDLTRNDAGATTDEEIRRRLRQALDLWRGPVLGGWLPPASHAALCGDIEAAHLLAVEDLAKVELDLGRHQAVVDEITAFATANPSRERLTWLAMTALHRTHRTAEALHLFQRCRRWLAEELGLDPGADLQRLHLALLGSDGGSGDGHPRPAAGESQLPNAPALSSSSSHDFTAAIPQQLPAAVADFTAREVEANRLHMVFTEDRPDVRLAVVTGPAGVGKTALSLHVAHQMRQRYREGQLYIDLHGMDRSDVPDSRSVLAWFLRSLGVSDLPESLDERATLYRDLLATRHVLVLLDNARDANQVRPLIPGSPTCAVIITSRSRLATAVGGISVELGVLDNTQALSLLSRIVGEERTTPAAGAATSLVQMCGGLPLAIRIVAARLLTKPHWSLAQHRERLADERKRLDQLSYQDLDVRASLALSYANLSVDARQLLCRLGDIDIPDITVWSSAALLGCGPADAEEALEALHDAQLLEVAGQETGGYCRYRLHDLVRLFARERAPMDADHDDMESARTRMFGSWLYLVETAYGKIYGGTSENIPSPAERHVVDRDLADAITTDPVAWIGTARQSIVLIARRAAQHQHVAACWGLASTAFSLLEMGRYSDDCHAILGVAMEAVEKNADTLGRAAVRLRLGSLHANQTDDNQALLDYQSAADLFARAGNAHGQAMADLYVAMMYRRLDHTEQAMDQLRQAIAALDGLDQGAEAFALRNLAQSEITSGLYDEAQAHLDRALDLARRAKSRRREAQVLFHHGMLHLKRAQESDAERVFLEVLTLVRTLGDRVGEIQALRGLALCHKARGDTTLARSTLTQALHLAQQPKPMLMETIVRNEIKRLTHKSPETA